MRAGEKRRDGLHRGAFVRSVQYSRGLWLHWVDPSGHQQETVVVGKELTRVKMEINILYNTQSGM